jgi:hypothetical protein
MSEMKSHGTCAGHLTTQLMYVLILFLFFYQTRGKMKPVQHSKGEYHEGNGTIDSNNSGR